MKLFTLLSGQELHLVSQKSIIPASEFSTLLTAQEVQEAVTAGAQAYRQEVARECERLKEKAQQEGFEQGMQQWAGQFEQLQKDYEHAKGQVEQAIIEIALTAAKKIVGRELEVNPQALGDIISTHLKTVSHFRRVIVYLNQADLQQLDEQKEKMKKIFDRLEILSLKERSDIEPGGFIIETEGGILNLSTVDKQWKPLEAMFNSFDSQSEDRRAP